MLALQSLRHGLSTKRYHYALPIVAYDAAYARTQRPKGGLSHGTENES